MSSLDQQTLSPIDRAILKLAEISSTQPPSKPTGHGSRRIARLRPARTSLLVELPAERREHPRRDGSSQVAMSFDLMNAPNTSWKLHSTPHRGHLVDLSMRGCAFHSRLPAPANSAVSLRFADDEFDDGRVLNARIIRCDLRLDNAYRIVCRFTEHLSLEDLCQFGRNSFSYDVV